MIFSIIILLSIIPSITSQDTENSPPVADAGGPYYGYEGSPVMFDASGSYDPDNDPIWFNWDFDEDGWMDLRFWIDDPTINYTWLDDHIGIVTVFVEDDHQHISSDDAMVTIYNLNPIFTSVNSYPLEPTEIGDIMYLVCTFTDPGVLDTHKALIDWGDGIVEIIDIIGYDFYAEHIYAMPGVFSGTITLADDDGGFDIVEFEFTVIDSSINDEWDKSSIEVTADCEGENGVFTITNTGEPNEGDMILPREYRIYRNNVLETTGQFQLEGGESIDIIVYVGCDKVRLEADQHPKHPGKSRPRETLDECNCNN